MLARVLVATAQALLCAACSCQGSDTAPSARAVGSTGVTGAGGLASTDAGALTWQDTGIRVFGCRIERLVAPFPSLFEWTACDVRDCDTARFNAGVVRGTLGKGAGIGSPRVDAEGETHIGFQVTSDGRRFGCITSEQGRVLSGMRLEGGCGLAAPTLRGSAFSYFVSKSSTEQSYAAVLGTLEDATLSVVEIPPQTGKVPQWHTQGRDRVVWWWVPGDQLSSFSAADGSDFRFFVSAALPGPIVALRTPVGFNSGFLYEAVRALDSGIGQRTIFLSNGIDAGRQLVPSEPGFDYGQAEFVQSHVAWLRGHEPAVVNGYVGVELWAAPWTGGVLGVSKKVGAVDTLVDGTAYHTMPAETAGGYGHYLLPGPGRIDLWNVSKATFRRYALPRSTPAFAPSGVSRTHAYVNARAPRMELQTHLYRFPF
jgi:hypothetical protein